MPYEAQVGNPALTHCSLCRSERVIDPDTRMVWCRRCDAAPLELSLQKQGHADG